MHIEYRSKAHDRGDIEWEETRKGQQISVELGGARARQMRHGSDRANLRQIAKALNSTITRVRELLRAPIARV